MPAKPERMLSRFWYGSGYRGNYFFYQLYVSLLMIVDTSANTKQFFLSTMFFNLFQAKQNFKHGHASKTLSNIISWAALVEFSLIIPIWNVAMS